MDMYCYVYDTCLSDHRYAKVLQKIETRLVDLGIAGAKVHLSLLKNVHESVAEQRSSGACTFIAVGGDKTLFSLIDAVALLGVTVGYIPVGEYPLATMLGIVPDEGACDILSARITKEVDVGAINHYYFFTGVKIISGECALTCDDSYHINLDEKNCSVEIININTRPLISDFVGEIDPCDGKLNMVVSYPARVERSLKNLFRKSSHSLSFFTVDRLTVSKGRDVKAIVDGYRTVNMPIEIRAMRRALKLIVGKNRTILL